MSDKFLLPETDAKRRRKAKKSKFPQPRYFKPEFPHKYVGDPNKIIARSNLERKFFKVFDLSPSVIHWGSEEMHIRYRSSVDDQIHRYFPDAIVKLKTRSGQFKVYMIEIKPKVQCSPPKKRNSKKYLTEQMTYQVNQDKWKAAEAFCKAKGMEFLVLTEDHVGGW